MAAGSLINTSRSKQNADHLAEDIFQVRFIEWKSLYFDSDITEVCSSGSH